MSDIFFADVFYSIENDYLFELNGKAYANSLPCAVSVPHAKASLIQKELGTAFSAVRNVYPKTVAILCPLHAPLLKKDCGYAAATTAKKEIAGLKTAQIKLPRTVQNDAYFKEEPAAEELFPAIRRLFPDAKILPVFAPQNAGSNELKEIVHAIKNADTDTLFIVSSNKTDKGHCAKMWLNTLCSKWEKISTEGLREVLFAEEV